MCLPALAASLVCFLGLLGEAMEELLQRNGFGALCFEICKCRMLMPMCNITFIGKHKYYHAAQSNSTSRKLLTFLPIAILD